MSKLDPIRTVSETDLKLSRASAGRLSLYLRCLEGFHRDGLTKVSSGQVGEALGLSDAQVRKDLACLGNLGQPGIGYAVPEVIGAIRRALGIDREWKAVIVGIGNLARALMRYRGFQQQGFRVVALCDNDPKKVGENVEELIVRSLDDLPEIVGSMEAEMGILTVPAEAAQPVADQLAAAGVRGILNFAPTVLKMPPGVSVVPVDLAIQLEQLAFQIQWSANER